MQSKIVSASISVIAVFMIGCGSSDSTTDTASVPTTPTEITDTLTQEVASQEYNVSGTYTYTDNNGNTMLTIRKISADGAFEAYANTDQDSNQTYVGYKLLDTLNELTMTQVTATDIGIYDDNSGSGTVTIISNLADGTVHLSGTNSLEGNFDCVQTYDVGDMPKIITSTDDFEQYIYFYNFQKLSTTCPDWIENDEPSSGSNEFVTTIEVTDDAEEISTIKIYDKETPLN